MASFKSFARIIPTGISFRGHGLLSFFLIHVAQYLTWTRAEAATIVGIQGRYFIPLAIPVMLIFFNRIIPRASLWCSGGIVTVFAAFVLYAAVWPSLRDIMDNCRFLDKACYIGKYASMLQSALMRNV